MVLQVNSRTQEKDVKCSKLAIKRVESRPGVFIVNFEDISHLFFSDSIVDFE